MMDLLGLGIMLVVGLGVVLGVILLVTRGLFARDLTKALMRVTQQEQQLQEKAAILEQRISQMERDYHAKLKHAQTEADRLTQDAKGQAMNIRTAAVEEAKHRARQLLLEAESAKTQWKTAVAKELNGKAVQHACEILRVLLPAPTCTALHEALIQELLGVLGQLDRTRVGEHVEEVILTTAQPLTEPHTQQLTRWITTTMGGEVPVRVQTDPQLIAGWIVRIGSMVVDNSLPNRLQTR